MKTSKLFHVMVVAVTCLGVCFPAQAFANPKVPHVNGIPVVQEVGDLSLRDGTLVGGLVDENGRGVADAPVVIGQQGEAVAKIRTDEDGRFAVEGLKPGVYQVVSHGAVTTHRVWAEKNAPAGAKKGVIHSVDPQVARGAPSHGGLLGVLSNPLVLALAIAAAIAIPLALDDDDDAS